MSAAGRFAIFVAGGLMAAGSIFPAYAQDTAVAAPAPVNALEVELNSLTPSQKGCMMTFVALNKLGAPVNKISFELAFFNDRNTVEKITVLDFRDLPQGKKRVRQFDMPNVKCDALTRILINDTPVCDGPAAGECMKGLVTRSQVAVLSKGNEWCRR